MSSLTFEEFCKLPRSEQNVRYPELSDHDRFLARMNDLGLSLEEEVVPLTQEELSALSPEHRKMIEELFNAL